MASILGHTVVGYTIAKVGGVRLNNKVLWIATALAFFPDADIILHNMGVSYDSVWGHRGFSHSLTFALVLGILFSLPFKNHRWQIALIFGLSMASHGVLDAMTTGGRGIAFFWPWENARYFLSWRFIKVSPMSLIRFISDWGWQVIKSELLFLVLPCSMILGVNSLIRSWNRHRSSVEQQY